MAFAQYRTRPATLFGCLMAFTVLVALVMHRLVGYGVPTPESLAPALQFGEHHRLAQVFLPVGYSGFLGLGMRLTRDAGLSLANFVIFVMLVSFCWKFLRAKGISATAATILSGLVGISPDVAVGIYKIADTAMTAMFLFAMMGGILLVIRAPQRWANDLLLALMLGWAVATRTNLLLLAPLSWLLWKKFNVPRLSLRIALQGVVGILVYLALTAAVHGRPFLPHNGPYNLFAGANEFTSEHMANEEDSLIPALAARGIVASVNWDVDADRPGINDARDQKLEPLYRQQALLYIERHPAQTAARVVWRLGIFMMPDLVVHPARTFGGVLKLFGFAIVPLWLLAVLFLPQAGTAAERVVVPVVVVTYVLPFLLIVSAPRFRVPLEIVCLADLLAMIWQWWRLRSARQSPRTAI